MASQSQGIQQLLQAEKRAAEKVAEARKRKLIRLSRFGCLALLARLILAIHRA